MTRLPDSNTSLLIGPRGCHMTEIGLDEGSHGEPKMNGNDDEATTRKLSPSARAVLRYVSQFEKGVELEVFHEKDDDIVELKRMLVSYRGSLYNALYARLQEVIALGDVSIISQRDVMSVIRNLWRDNVSRLSSTEGPFLEATLRSPGSNLKALAQRAELSYAQARRAQKRLFDAQVLRTRGLLNTDSLGLERVVIIMEAPSIVLSGPYIPLSLMVDGYSSLVLSFAVVPTRRRDDLLKTIRSTRSSTERTAVYGISPGKPRFSSLYFSHDGWRIDLLHFQLMLRNGGSPITLSSLPIPTTSEPSDLRASDLRIMDVLLEDFDITANDLSTRARVSTATAFRRRSEILKGNLILPRARVEIPALSDRICCIASPECTGAIMQAWSGLPLTYQSMIYNLEDASERSLLLMAALPAGSGQDVIGILQQEVSRVHDLKAFEISASAAQPLKISSLFDNKRGSWKWGSYFFDARNYGTLRREGSQSIPVDLAP